MIKTVDTDFVVIALSAMHKLNITSLWMAYGWHLELEKTSGTSLSMKLLCLWGLQCPMHYCSVADPELFLRGRTDLRGARSSHASMIPYIINQIFPTKEGGRAPRSPLDPRMLFLNAFSGCDQVSSFSNRGKKTAWETWSSFDVVTEDF